MEKVAVLEAKVAELDARTLAAAERLREAHERMERADAARLDALMADGGNRMGPTYRPASDAYSLAVGAVIAEGLLWNDARRDLWAAEAELRVAKRDWLLGDERSGR